MKEEMCKCEKTLSLNDELIAAQAERNFGHRSNIQGLKEIAKYVLICLV